MSFTDSSALNSYNSYEVIMKSMQAQLIKIYRQGFEDVAGEYATYLILGVAMIQSQNRRIAEAMVYGAAKLAAVDAQGEIVSHSQLSHKVVGVELHKQGSVLDIQDIDFINFQNVGEMIKIMRLVGASAIQGVVNQASHLVNNLNTGVYVTYNNETPGMLTRDADSLFMIGTKNIAQNMGANEWSPDNFIASLSLIDEQQTLDETSIPSKMVGILVDSTVYRSVFNDVMNRYFSGSDNYQRFFMSDIPLVGKVNFNNSKTWLIVTTASQIGWAVYAGYVLPSIFMTRDNVNRNVKIVTMWFNSPFCLSPWGFYLNYFA